MQEEVTPDHGMLLRPGDCFVLVNRKPLHDFKQGNLIFISKGSPFLL